MSKVTTTSPLVSGSFDEGMPLPLTTFVYDGGDDIVHGNSEDPVRLQVRQVEFEAAQRVYQRDLPVMQQVGALSPEDAVALFADHKDHVLGDPAAAELVALSLEGHLRACLPARLHIHLEHHLRLPLQRGRGPCDLHLLRRPGIQLLQSAWDVEHRLPLAFLPALRARGGPAAGAAAGVAGHAVAEDAAEGGEGGGANDERTWMSLKILANTSLAKPMAPAEA
eukprot:CAMPEP_0170370808 /NCGR_PEP_ID=MMETSP0117_2-20130122/8705_1 /TAXON_ID=400756 /ORGANISM="Durinskia baltica, Strain CSIRO CS-38" /LENGTH=222 /DNA_ID=CAMNT_0010625601 /DNA_START=35 /DNA_END=699 /DNA_ORIENTATION=+